MMKVPGPAAPKRFILVSRTSLQTGEGASDGVVTLARVGDKYIGNFEQS